MKINDRVTIEYQSQTMNVASVSVPPAETKVAELQYQLNLARKEVELVRREKALEHIKETLKKAKKLESEAKLREEDLINAQFECARLVRTTQLLENEVSTFQHNEKACKVCYLPLNSRPVAAIRKCGHVFCQTCIKSIAKKSGYQALKKMPILQMDQWTNFSFYKIIT